MIPALLRESGEALIWRHLLEPARVVALFFFGRSGSHFLQSFFDGHPQVLTAPASAIENVEEMITPEDLEAADAERLYASFPLVCEGLSPGAFRCHVQRLLDQLSDAGGQLTHERLLKVLFIARRVASGLPIDLTRPVTILWQAHTPTMARKRWILDTFEDPKLLTIVRFPEKAFDSHLVHHAFETLSSPLSTLFRRLLIDHMALSADVAGDGSRERAVRFEDLHGNPASVLEVLGAWLDVDPPDAANQFCFNVRGRNIVGARRLTRAEYEPKLLNHMDKIKVRHLLQENYRAWGYDQMILGGLDGALQEYADDPLVASLDFAAQGLIGTPHEEAHALKDAIIVERERRDAGIRLTPLLEAGNA